MAASVELWPGTPTGAGVVGASMIGIKPTSKNLVRPHLSRVVLADITSPACGLTPATGKRRHGYARGEEEDAKIGLDFGLNTEYFGIKSGTFMETTMAEVRFQVDDKFMEELQ